ncbi:MAG TPA: hypothetical protein VHD83_17850 [Puia sp.]|nr:hypothetical protein [Puia sp.]
MKHSLFLALTFLLASTLSAQPKHTYIISADSTRLTGPDSNELIIENHTQNVPGFLYNIGQGRTAFQHPLTKINDSFYLVGADTLQLRAPDAWLQDGNSFGTRGKFGTKDNNHIDFITNNSQRARLDSSGALLLGFTANSGYRLDVNGSTRISLPSGTTSSLLVSAGDAYDIQTTPNYINAFGSSLNASMISFGNIAALIGVNKAAVGSIPQNSLMIGGTSSGHWTTIIDGSSNPVYVVDGNGTATINGGYKGITYGSTGVTSNSNSPNLTITGGRGTGTGATGDIIFATGNAQTSGTTIHFMTNRWWIKGSTGYLSNTSSPTSSMDIAGANGYSQLGLRTTYTPTSSADTNGNVGDFCWDDNYIYVKTASGWKRAAVTTY